MLMESSPSTFPKNQNGEWGWAAIPLNRNSSQSVFYSRLLPPVSSTSPASIFLHLHSLNCLNIDITWGHHCLCYLSLLWCFNSRVLQPSALCTVWCHVDLALCFGLSPVSHNFALHLSRCIREQPELWCECVELWVFCCSSPRRQAVCVCGGVEQKPAVSLFYGLCAFPQIDGSDCASTLMFWISL